MHLHEAVLAGSPEGIGVLSAGVVGTAVGTAIGLRRMDNEHVPRVAVVTAAFFVLSSIHVPAGVTSVHLVLNGLVGLLLGWAAFPALLIALMLQAVLLGHGGVLALGINTLIMATPAVVCHHALRASVCCGNDKVAGLAGVVAGATAVLGAALLMATALRLSGEAFTFPALAVLVSHVVVALVEGLVTGGAVVFLRRVRPDILARPLLFASVSTDWCKG
ncbi:MAG: cobalt transporter CbiM [Planctomycetota bacterium]